MSGVYAVIPAAGSGKRMGLNGNKIFLELDGKPVIYHTVKAFEKSGVFDGIIIAAKPEEQPEISAALSGVSIKYSFVSGGSERQDSVKNALDALPENAEIVAIHDAARCLAEPGLIRSCVDCARKYGSGVAGRRVFDTVKTAENGLITGTVDRDSLVLIETPQTFDVALIKKAYESAYAEGFYGTDDSMLAERAGIKPKIVLSEGPNIKMTRPNDIEYGRFILEKRRSMRIGQGYDVHRFKEGRPLVLGGVTIESEFGLDGHSDADVLVHAIMDALLGAAGLKDIGSQFPDTDDAYKNIYSIELLKRVGVLLDEMDASIENIDATLIMQAPKIAPYRDEMVKNIASALGIEPERVSVKATTTEKLGFTGRKEGAAAQAICLIRL